MEEIFVTKIHLNKVRHLENIDIELSNTERKHLILTGKNGSGKTSVLEAIHIFVQNVMNKKITDEKHLAELQEHFPLYLSELKSQENSMRQAIESNQSYIVGRRTEMLSKTRGEFEKIRQLVPCNIEFNSTFSKVYDDLNADYDPLIFKMFESKHSFNLNESQGPQKLDLKSRYENTEYANENFRQLLVNFRMQVLDAKDKNQLWLVEGFETWLATFVQELKKLYSDDSLRFVFDAKNYNYNIILQNREPFSLNELSDGYASFLSITTELMMRMHGGSHAIFLNAYDLQGIVLIDEIETHLHIDLQRKILPFLTAFFPKIQFIVTTHSPFVLSSIDNAVIYDLEKNIRVEDLSGYSYNSIVKGYFDVDEYSKEIKDKIADYEQLIVKSHHDTKLLTLEEKEKYYELKRYFEGLPKTLSPELQLKIQQLELAELAQ